jgi:hypothetical protein
MGLWNAPSRSTVDRQPLSRARARRGLAFGSSGGRGNLTRGEEEEGSTGVPVLGSPGLERRWSGSAMTVKAASVGVTVNVGVRRGGAIRGAPSGFYRVGEGAQALGNGEEWVAA